MIARDPRATWKYVLVADRELPREQRTVWHFKHLTIEQEHARIDTLIDVGRGHSQLSAKQLDALRTNLVGCENFQAPDGSLVSFEKGPRGGASEAFLARVPVSARGELADAIENETEVTEEELGKSAPPSTSGTASGAFPAASTPAS